MKKAWALVFLAGLVMFFPTRSKCSGCDAPCVLLQQSTCDTGCEGGSCVVLGEEACCCPAGAPELSPRGVISSLLLLTGGVMLIAYWRRRARTAA